MLFCVVSVVYMLFLLFLCCFVLFLLCYVVFMAGALKSIASELKFMAKSTDESRGWRGGPMGDNVGQVGPPPLFLRFSIGKCRNCLFFRAFY